MANGRNVVSCEMELNLNDLSCSFCACYCPASFEVLAVWFKSFRLFRLVLANTRKNFLSSVSAHKRSSNKDVILIRKDISDAKSLKSRCHFATFIKIWYINHRTCSQYNSVVSHLCPPCNGIIQYKDNIASKPFRPYLISRTPTFTKAPVGQYGISRLDQEIVIKNSYFKSQAV